MYAHNGTVQGPWRLSAGKALLHSIDTPQSLNTSSGYMPLPMAVEASGMQLEILATFSLPLPPGLSVGLAVRRSKDGCADPSFHTFL
jgi:hypothetical protein